MWAPLTETLALHIAFLEKSGLITDWPMYQKLWDRIKDNLKILETGEVIGTSKIFIGFKFCEELAQCNVLYYRVAGSLLAVPIIEDLIEFDGLYNVIEDFFLKTYSLAPKISKTKDSSVCVTFPGSYQRLVSRYPSPRKAQSDFEHIVGGIQALSFKTEIKRDRLTFTVSFPDCESEKEETPFVKIAKKMLNSGEISGCP